MSAVKELRELGVEELQSKVKDLRQELFNLRFQHATHQLENVMRIPSVRRTVARALTLINEKTLGLGA
jgi:large subunit ribosomal protein L29